MEYKLIPTESGYVVTSDEERNLKIPEIYYEDKKAIAGVLHLPKILNSDQLYNMWKEAQWRKEAEDISKKMYWSPEYDVIQLYLTAKRDTFTKEEMIEFAEWIKTNINTDELYESMDGRGNSEKSPQELLDQWLKSLKITNKVEVTIEQSEEGIIITKIII